VVVDLPESTWPMTTTLMCIFSLLRRPLACCADAVGCGGRWMLQGCACVLTHPMMAVVERNFGRLEVGSV